MKLQKTFSLMVALAFLFITLFKSPEFRYFSSMKVNDGDGFEIVLSSDTPDENESSASNDEAPYSVFPELSAVVEARYFLTDIKVTTQIESNTTYAGVRAYFCPIDWTIQKEAPNTVPRYSNIMGQKKCSEKRISFDFADIVGKARNYDQTKNTKVHSLTQSGFIYHESRCGSTLAANMWTAADPSAHRVYSEPNVLLAALKSKNTQLVNDVLYMLGRSSDAKEKRVFYKFKSTIVRQMKHMPSHVPWIFLYRDPEEVIASHFNPTEWKSSRVVCLLERDNPNSFTYQVAKEQGKKLSNMSDPEFCSARLASLCLAAIQEHAKTKQGRFFNYNTLPGSMWETILPKHFGVDVNSRMIERMKEISGVYSKGRQNKTEEWQDDEKQAGLSDEQRQAAHIILEPYYIKMEEFAKEK
jgi:hypothetical protein